MADLEAIPVPVDSFAVRGIEEETIFLAKEGNEIHILDDIGTSIWKAIDGSRSLSDILDHLCDEYEVTRDTAKEDLIRFVTELAEKGIITLETRQ